MNDGTNKINPDQNHVPYGEEKLLKSLNSQEGGGTSVVEGLPNSSELINSESSDTGSQSKKQNESEVLLTGSQGGETDVSDESAGTAEDWTEDEELPPTTVVLDTSWGVKVYVVGTAHFSEQSQEDVAKVIRAVRPNYIVLELCRSRSSMLQWDEDVMLKMSENLDFKVMKQSIKTYGFFQGIVQLLLLSVSSQITRKMGMAPGGEFRRAFKESLDIPGCVVYLGDRPIEVTLRRAFASITWWQLIKFAYSIIVSKAEFSEEDIEKCKNRDSLENMLDMFDCEFPALKEVFVNERDLYLTFSLLNAAKMNAQSSQSSPNTVVGVVGMGHLDGIQNNWAAGVTEKEINRLSEIPPQTRASKVLKFALKASIFSLAIYGLHKLASKIKFNSPS